MSVLGFHICSSWSRGSNTGQVFLRYRVLIAVFSVLRAFLGAGAFCDRLRGRRIRTFPSTSASSSWPQGHPSSSTVSILREIYPVLYTLSPIRWFGLDSSFIRLVGVFFLSLHYGNSMLQNDLHRGGSRSGHAGRSRQDARAQLAGQGGRLDPDPRVLGRPGRGEGKARARHRRPRRPDREGRTGSPHCKIPDRRINVVSLGGAAAGRATAPITGSGTRSASTSLP